MTGRLIAVVGPSGVGKDTVMAALAARCPDLHLVRRVVTRPPERDGEPFEGVSAAQFEARRRARAFLLSWEAHGLSYGIPVEVRAVLEAGRDALANLSRGVLAEARARVPRLLVLSLTAPEGVRAARLAARGREQAADIAGRLGRAGAPLPPGLPVVTIDNGGALADTVAAAMRALYPERV